MAVTLEDLDRRVTALEKAGETEKNIVRAVSEIVAESETRMGKRITESEERMKDWVSASERRTVGAMNDFEQRIMAALDRLQNPPT
jgi:hypothetical protein